MKRDYTALIAEARQAFLTDTGYALEMMKGATRIHRIRDRAQEARKQYYQE